MKSVRIRSFSGPYFPSFGLNTERYSVSLRISLVQMLENTDQKNSEYGHFSRSVIKGETLAVILFCLSAARKHLVNLLNKSLMENFIFCAVFATSKTELFECLRLQP